MKLLGTGCYGINPVVILPDEMPNTIQPREYSKGGGMEGILYTTDSDGNLNVFNVKRNDDGKQWLNANNGNPDNFWNAENRWVFLRRNSFHFSPALVGEFCFASCPIQPPSIRPISSIFTDRGIYFLSSMDFVSHRTMRSTLKVSIFLTASRI
jgi:hypothetical protein